MNKIKNPIEMYHFMHPLYRAKSHDYGIELILPISSNIAVLYKDDVIAMAKHFDLEVTQKKELNNA
jgi:hypothetical protein